MLEQASLVSDEPLIAARHLRTLLPLDESVPAAAVRNPDSVAGHSLPQAVAALEQRLIQEALQATGGNKQAAARRLGIARATLYEKLALMGAPGAAAAAGSGH